MTACHPAGEEAAQLGPGIHGAPGHQNVIQDKDRQPRCGMGLTLGVQAAEGCGNSFVFLGQAGQQQQVDFGRAEKETRSQGIERGALG